MKPDCFASLNCPEDYKCPLFEECGQALVEETEKMPLEVWHIVQRQMIENKSIISWKVRSKK